MKRKYSDSIKEGIGELKAQIDIYLERLGEERAAEILYNHFALSKDDAREWIHIFSSMIVGATYETVPEGWFFKTRPIQRRRPETAVTLEMRRGRKSHPRGTFKIPSLKEEAPELREEQFEIKKRVRAFMNLPEDVKRKVLQRWPPKYHDCLMGEEIEIADSMEKLSAARIANRILAERWGASEQTIESYVKQVKQGRQ